MNLVDLLLAVIVGVSIATGFMAGFARVGIGFAGMVCGLMFGFWYYGVPALWIRERWMMSANASNMFGFFAVFALCLIAAGLIGMLIAKLFKWTGLSWLDRFLGGPMQLAFSKEESGGAR